MNNEEMLWREIAKLKRTVAQLRTETGMALQKTNNLGRPIYAHYNTNAAQSIANNTWTIIDYEDKVEDTHNAVTTGASWKFTAPATRIYTVSAMIGFAASSEWDLGEHARLNIYKNGADFITLQYVNTFDLGATTIYLVVGGSAQLYLKTYDTISIHARQLSGATINLSTYTATNHCIISA